MPSRANSSTDMDLQMTDTTVLGLVFLAVTGGIPLLGWTLRRVLKKVYSRDTDRPDRLPSNHGVDRRVPDR